MESHAKVHPHDRAAMGLHHADLYARRAECWKPEFEYGQCRVDQLSRQICRCYDSEDGVLPTSRSVVSVDKQHGHPRWIRPQLLPQPIWGVLWHRRLLLAYQAESII